MKMPMANQSLPTIRFTIKLMLVIFWMNATAFAIPISPDHAEARELVQAKKWSEAVVVFRGLLKKDYRSSSIALELADAMMQSHRREEALALLQTYLEAEVPARGKAKSAASRNTNVVSQDQLRAKIQILSTVFLTQESFQLYQDALALMLQQKWKLALEKWVKAQNLEPDNALVLVRMGQASIELNDYDTATEKLKFAKKLNPLHPDILMWLGRALFFKGELESARVELESAYRLDPHNERIVLWLYELFNSSTASAKSTQLNGKKSPVDATDPIESPDGAELIEKFVKENPGQMSAQLIYFRNRLVRSDGDRAKLHVLRNDMLKGEAMIQGYFQPRTLSSPESKSPFFLENRPSIEQLRSELQLLIRDVELKISRLEKRGV